MTNERLIELLGEIRACYNCFDKNEREKYEALSEAIQKCKSREYTKLIPCVCGGKRRTLWYHPAKDGMWDYECIKCGRRSPLGKTQEEAKKNWNEFISKLIEINSFYGAHTNTCEDCELFVTPTDPTRGTYCVRAQGFVFQHNPACKDFAKRKEETDDN